jgi:hypothetical protein
MPHLNKSNGTHKPTKAVVLFGIGDEGKPQAGLFSASHSDLAKKAAKQLGLKAIDLSAGELDALALKIPAGRLYANRRTFVPAVRRELHQKLVQFAKMDDAGAGDKPNASNPKSPPPAGIPKDWHSIAPGQQVIAQASLSDGWWEAIVMVREGDILTLKWRDAPQEPLFKVHLSQVAIQQLASSP